MTDLTDYELSRIDSSIQYEEIRAGRNVALALNDSERLYAEANRCDGGNFETRMLRIAIRIASRSGEKRVIVLVRVARVVHDLVLMSRRARKGPVKMVDRSETGGAVVDRNLIELIESLPEKQREALGQLCLDNDPGHHPRTLEALERKGLAAWCEVELPGHPPVNIKRWGPASLAVHIAWCKWCSDSIESQVKS